ERDEGDDEQDADGGGPVRGVEESRCRAGGGTLRILGGRHSPRHYAGAQVTTSEIVPGRRTPEVLGPAAGAAAGGCRRTGTFSAAPCGDFVGQLRHHGEEVAHDTEIGELEYRRLRVLVDHGDRLRRLHSGAVLNCPGNSDREVELRRNGHPGLP